MQLQCGARQGSAVKAVFALERSCPNLSVAPVWAIVWMRVTIALKMAACTLRLSNTYLGAQFRRLRTKLGGPIAIKAMAAKLARLVYRMLRYGMKYVDQGAPFYQAQHRQLQIKQLKWKATKLGFRLVEAHAA